MPHVIGKQQAGAHLIWVSLHPFLHCLRKHWTCQKRNSESERAGESCILLSTALHHNHPTSPATYSHGNTLHTRALQHVITKRQLTEQNMCKCV